MPQGGERLYLAESVAIVISVKSNLSSQWREVESEVLALRTVRRMWLGAAHLTGDSIGFSGPTESPIPILAVGYVGYQHVESLEKRVMETKEEARPEAVLVIESGAFVGAGIKAWGSTGLYAATIVAAAQLTQVQRVNTNLFTYVT